MKLEELIRYIKESLKANYIDDEKRVIAYLLAQHFTGKSKEKLIADKDEIVSDDVINKAKDTIDKLNNFYPIQYLIGEVEFYNIKLRVNSNVLIPRPETEELVDWILKDYKDYDNLKILDACTGSGCIAISIAFNKKDSMIDALDVSKEAIDLAKENAKLNLVNVNFFEYDVLNFSINNWKGCNDYDVIISNPPYIPLKEKDKLQPQIVHFEPPLALFVEDDDPLIFYKKISEMATKILKPGGSIYFEVNENYGIDVVKLLIDYGFSNIILKKDLNEKDRMVKAIKK